MELSFNLVGGACWVIDVDKKFKIGCDPALAPKGTKYSYKGLKTSRIKPPVYNETTFDNVKVWILTHGHFDHIDKEGVNVIQDESIVVSIKNCSKLLKDRDKIDVSYIDWYQKKNIEIENYQIEIQAIPAFHGTNLFARMLMGKVNGYLLTISNGTEDKSVYVTSDTVFHEEIISALKNHKIDVLIANLGNIKSDMWGGPFTMNTIMLDNFIKELKPTTTIPIHIDDFAHYETSRLELKNEMKVLENGEFMTMSEAQGR